MSLKKLILIKSLTCASVLFVITGTVLMIEMDPKVCDVCFNENHNHYYCKVFFEKCSNK